jgi:hypothetical protein
MNRSSAAIPIVLISLLALCCCLIVVLCAGFYALTRLSNSISLDPIFSPFQGFEPTPTLFELTRQPPDSAANETIEVLRRTVAPENDIAALACRYKLVCGVPATVPPPAVPYLKGDSLTFWVNNTDSNEYFQVETTLQYATPHAYFWAENGAMVDDQEVADLLEAFEAKIYPTNRQFFGSEWTPGVDGDPHVYIVYTGGLGYSVAGYFYSPDEYNPVVRQYSNAHETFYISSSQDLGDEYTYGTLAHEFQHMIHWHQDRNESSFLNEGFSELATFLNGYDTGGFDWFFLMDPDLNVTDWLGETGDNTAHYGASFLFVTYFLDRFGETATQALVHEPQNGLASIDQVLNQLQIQDPQTGQPIDADDFFLDWTIANYLRDAAVGDGRYTYNNYPRAPQASETEVLDSCPVDRSSRTVNQYGADYLRITCPGDYTLRFEGATTTDLLPVDPRSGQSAFWSNKGDESDMTLTRSFDFTGLPGPIELTYWIWYDIEEDYDYLYLAASPDGQSWEILETPTCTNYNPTGNSYGCGYTGSSSGWIQQTVDLSRYAGRSVMIRFEYITDPAVNGEGLLLDDLAIRAMDYFTDFEADEGGWQPDGFVRIQNTLPQSFRLALITTRLDQTTVELIPVSADQSASIPLSVGRDGVQEVVLVVTGTTRFTRSLAAYQFEIH